MFKKIRFQLTLLIILLASNLFAQVKVMTWNLKNVGSSKNEVEISYIAKIIKQADIIAIQEVVTNPSGAQTIAKIADELNRKSGTKWDYSISDPTKSSPYRSERYAYIWKTSTVKLIDKPHLESNYVEEIEREPYMATFRYQQKEFTIVNFHALPTKHQPETEIKYLKFLPEKYPNLNLVFVGDFNLKESHSVFNPLKKLNYQPMFTKQKTSLKQKCINGDCLASEYDNIFLPIDVFTSCSTKVVHFYNDFETIEVANKISDHIPLIVEFE